MQKFRRNQNPVLKEVRSAMDIGTIIVLVLTAAVAVFLVCLEINSRRNTRLQQQQLNSAPKNAAPEPQPRQRVQRRA